MKNNIRALFTNLRIILVIRDLREQQSTHTVFNSVTFSFYLFYITVSF